MGRTPKPPGERVRDLMPTQLRLPEALRAALVREAHISGRSLNTEIGLRLQHSLQAAHTPIGGDGAGPEAAAPRVLNETPAPYGGQALTLTQQERLLLRLFNQMSVERQLALLAVLRGK